MVNEKSLKNYIISKKSKKASSNFTLLKTDHLCSIDDFFIQSFSVVGAVNTNDVVGPQISNITAFSTYKKVKELKLEDFKIIKVIGRGSFGKISLIEYLPTHEVYAMKNLKKDLLIEKDLIENILLEKEIL